MKTKLLFIIGLFVLVACSGNRIESNVQDSTQTLDSVAENTIVQKQETANQSEEKQIEIQQNCDGTANDILLLKSNTELFNSFFEEIKKWKKENDANDLDNDGIFTGITKPLLKDFLSNIDIEKLKTEESFEKEYEFNIMPKAYRNKEKCPDGIRLYYYKESCRFRLCVDNSYYVKEADLCTEGSIIYSFKIKHNRIIDLEITAAG